METDNIVKTINYHVSFKHQCAALGDYEIEYTPSSCWIRCTGPVAVHVHSTYLPTLIFCPGCAFNLKNKYNQLVKELQDEHRQAVCGS